MFNQSNLFNTPPRLTAAFVSHLVRRPHWLMLLALAVMILAGCASSGDRARTQEAPAAAAATESTLDGLEAARQMVEPPHQDFGLPMQGDPADVVTADIVLASPADYDGQPVRIRGVVQEVCPKRGCWMRVGAINPAAPKPNANIAPAGDAPAALQTIFVKFTCPIEGRLIPMDAVNQPVIVEGTLQQARISQAAARHYAEDGGATPEELEKIVGPQPILRMASASARVIGVSAKDDAAAQQ